MNAGAVGLLHLVQWWLGSPAGRNPTFTARACSNSIKKAAQLVNREFCLWRGEIISTCSKTRPGKGKLGRSPVLLRSVKYMLWKAHAWAVMFAHVRTIASNYSSAYVVLGKQTAFVRGGSYQLCQWKCFSIRFQLNALLIFIIHWLQLLVTCICPGELKWNAARFDLLGRWRKWCFSCLFSAWWVSADAQMQPCEARGPSSVNPSALA